MKELTIEQKAKAYDEAIERAKKWRNAPNVDKIPTFANRVIEEIFPELKESKDEIARKWLIEILKEHTQHDEPCIAKDALVWLEKQGESIEVNPTEFDLRLNRLLKQFESLPKEELASSLSFYLNVVQNDGTYKQNPTNKVEPKFKVGDEIKTANEEPLTITKIDEKGYWSEDLFICGFGDAAKWELVGKSISKIDPKFHEGDWVVVSTIKGDRVVQIASVEYLKDGYPSYITTEGRWFGNGTKARLLTDKDVEIATIPESKIVVSKSKYWSEEDEDTLAAIIAIIRKQYNGTNIEEKKYYNVLINWLKSLKDRYFWKPNGKNEKLTDVNHEYFSELLESDDSKDINDYAYQVAYCISHDWLKETATWDDVEKACKLGAEWNKRHHKSAWSDEDKKMIGRIRSIVEKYAFSQSAVDVNGDLCEKEYIDADNWLKSLKDRVYPKQEWSEMDENIISEVIQNYESGFLPSVIERDRIVKALKSLKQKIGWKPSDEQMRALEYIINNAHNTSYSCKIAKELLEQLRKLKGEEV